MGPSGVSADTVERRRSPPSRGTTSLRRAGVMASCCSMANDHRRYRLALPPDLRFQLERVRLYTFSIYAS